MQKTYAEDSKRIAKNTTLLYMRTFLTIMISLYASRVILNVLGETNFGIYNIVGGVVVLFTFIQGAMATATQRFLNFEMGRGDCNSVNRVFSMSVTAHISIALLIFIFAETVGLWFVNTQLNIPPEKIVAAQWVYQFSVATTCVNILRVPYHAMLVAYEKMDFYAYISILESAFKLLIVYVLLIIYSDKLIAYGALVFIVALLITLCYKIYCNREFAASSYRPFWDVAQYKQLMSFSGWSLFGSAASVGASQGVNVLINIFYGVTINAAVGISNQVLAAVTSFATNFQTAFNPQLVKSYAIGDYDYFMKLIFQTSKLSFYLIYILILPLIICAEPVLTIWLKDVPEYTVVFTQLMLVFVAIDALSAPIWLSVQATGKIKRYQLLMAILIASNLPIDYYLLAEGYSPTLVFVVRVIVNLITHLVRVIYLKRLVNLPLRRYVTSVIARIVMVIMLTAPISMIVNNYTSGFMSIIATTTVSILTILVVVCFVGLSSSERSSIKAIIKLKFSH